MALDGLPHRLRDWLPAPGAALDVGEEEGDGSAGILGHGRLRRCGVVASVATTSAPAQRRSLGSTGGIVRVVNDEIRFTGPNGRVSAGGSAASGADSGCRAFAGRLDRRLQPARHRGQRLSHASLDRALVGRRCASADTCGGQRHPAACFHPTAGHLPSSRIVAVGSSPGSCRSMAANRAWRPRSRVMRKPCTGRQMGDGC